MSTKKRTEIIIRNAAKCLKCDSIIESTHRYDFRSCKCGSIFVDGGHDYIRRVGDLDLIEDMSIIEERDE